MLCNRQGENSAATPQLGSSDQNKLYAFGGLAQFLSPFFLPPKVAGRIVVEKEDRV
jgi:hypothetical protein